MAFSEVEGVRRGASSHRGSAAIYLQAGAGKIRHEDSARPPAQDGAREEARLVVIEMLTPGYTPDQIAAYLRQTFAVEDTDALLAEAGSIAG